MTDATQEQRLRAGEDAQRPAERLPDERVPTQVPATPMELLDRALAMGATSETLSQLMDLQDRHESKQARRAFDAAMSAAKAEFEPIVKNREVDFTSGKGRTKYKYEDLAGIARAVDPILAKHGLSYRFRSTQDGSRLTVTCIVSHRDGYSEETSLTAGNDESGNKSSIQAVGSTATFLQRYTLKLALGLAAAADDDAQSATAGNDAVTDEQAAEIEALAEEVKADKTAFLKYFKIASFADVRSRDYERAIAALEKKREAA